MSEGDHRISFPSAHSRLLRYTRFPCGYAIATDSSAAKNSSLKSHDNLRPYLIYKDRYRVLALFFSSFLVSALFQGLTPSSWEAKHRGRPHLPPRLG